MNYGNTWSSRCFFKILFERLVIVIIVFGILSKWTARNDGLHLLGLVGKGKNLQLFFFYLLSHILQVGITEQVRPRDYRMTKPDLVTASLEDGRTCMK